MVRESGVDGRETNPLRVQTEREYQALVIDYNESSAPYPSDQSVIVLFEAQAARTPEHEAIRFGADALTYRELNDRANQVAARLRSLGVVPSQLVVIYMEHSIEVVCAMLGVLKAGAAYVPVDAAIPEERLAFMLRDISEELAGTAPVLVTQSRLVSNLPSVAAQVVTLDADLASVDGYPVSNPPTPVSPHDLAYVIYTSGTTGAPKGVMIDHRSLVNYIWWANEQYCRGERLTWPLFSSLAFDLTVTSIFTPLISGGRIVVYRDSQGGHGTAIFKIIEDGVADIIKLTPAHLAMIKDTDLRGSRIRRLIVGGEDFKTTLARDITDNFGRPVEIYNEYGPTESTVGCMIHQFDREKDLARSVPIGRPAANTRIYVLDEHFDPVPTGVIGEMYLAGDGLARGYFNRPALTAQAFVTAEDPGQKGPGTTFPGGKAERVRLYKTGDLARWTVDGRMEFLGRTDHQVKIGGFRIELGEIEACLTQHADIRESVVDVVHSVAATPDEAHAIVAEVNSARDAGPAQVTETGIDRLVAYFVSDRLLTAPAIRAHLARQLPEYMLPTHFVRLDKLPLTSSGKVDRKALPPLSSGDTQPARDVAEPRTATEKALAAIWTGLLNVQNVGTDDDFFVLGGHSLLAIKAVSRIRDVLGVDLQILTLFENPTIGGLSIAVSQAIETRRGRATGRESLAAAAIQRISRQARPTPVTGRGEG
jgi:iturin family lipopeptide synthetase A/iturin family lipopeptide synthetase C/tyrocidine synthetase-3